LAEVHGAGVHLSYKMDMAAYDRVMTKIGVNLCAKLFGPDFVRRPEFKPTKDYARTGVGHVLKVMPGNAHLIQDQLGSPLEHHHVFSLHEIKVPVAGSVGL
jgi:hypothetical protein